MEGCRFTVQNHFEAVKKIQVESKLAENFIGQAYYDVGQAGKCMAIPSHAYNFCS